VSVACPPGPLAADLDAIGVDWRRWPASRSPGPRTLREIRDARSIVRAVAPDVVHLHSSKAGLAGRLAVGGRLPTIFQPHGWSWLAARGVVRCSALAWERLSGDLTDAVVCVGDGEAEMGRAAGITSPLRVVRNGVDCTRFILADAEAVRSARARLGLPESGAIVLCPGRLSRQKGQDVLLTAWPSVLERCPQASLVLVGAGDPAEMLSSARLRGVRFMPAVTDLRPWYIAADVVAVPSRWEGLPLVALEAAASGRPVVGSAIPGLTEVVAASTGVLVPPTDPPALADALVRLLTDPHLRRCQGSAARTRALTHFELAHTHQRLAALTYSVASLARRRPRRPNPRPRERVTG
jgi:glycosyltransferase involved in cell wall biosynthesis